MGKKKKQYSLRVELLRKIIVFICLPLFVILAVLSVLLHRSVNSDIRQNSSVIVNQAASKLELIMETVNYCSSALMTNNRTRTNVYSILRAPNEYPAWEGRYQLMTELQYLATISLSAYSGDIAILIENMELINRTGMIRLDPSLKKEEWYQKTSAGKGSPLWFSSIEDVFPPHGSSGPGDLIMARAIIPYQGESPGIILVRLPGLFIWPNPGSSPSAAKDCYALYGGEGALICYSNASDAASPMENIAGIDSIYPGRVNERDKPAIFFINDNFFVAYHLNISNCTLVYSAQREAVFSLGRRITWAFVWAVILIITAVTLLVLRISAQITLPLNHLIEDIRKLDKGAFQVRHQKSFTEVEQLSLQFNDALTRIDNLINQVHEESRLREEAYFETLQAQINPHFLFNTLNTVRWTALANGDTAVGNLLAELGIMLTAAYNHNDKLVPLHEELRLLEAYASIMRARYSNSFFLAINVDKSAQACLVPKFSLQPLVENAIIHGIDGMEDGLIKVEGFIRNDELWVSVYNNGAAADLEKINRVLEEGPEKNRNKEQRYTSIGLHNVNARIKIEFGAAYGLSADAQTGPGCRIWLKIPSAREALC
jgi:anti-sigma regulatory factor (Ser/Thr protein kinase)